MMPGATPPVFKRIDALLLLGAALAVVAVMTQIGTVLNYHWKWSAIPRFFVRWDADSGSWVSILLLDGFVTTIRLSIGGAVISLLAGIAVGFLRLSPSLGMRLIGATYVETIRNIPPLVFVFVVYFFLATQVVAATGLETWLRTLGPTSAAILTLLVAEPSQVSSFLPGVLSLGLFSGAYVAEIIRAGVQSIEAGQWDAAKALGFDRRATMRLVIVPQALSRMWGPLSNEFILLVKFSSLASLVSVPDLTFQAYQVGVTTRSMFEIWIVVAGLYFVISAGFAALFRSLERRSARPFRR